MWSDFFPFLLLSFNKSFYAFFSFLDFSSRDISFLSWDWYSGERMASVVSSVSSSCFFCSSSFIFYAALARIPFGFILIYCWSSSFFSRLSSGCMEAYKNSSCLFFSFMASSRYFSFSSSFFWCMAMKPELSSGRFKGSSSSAAAAAGAGSVLFLGGSATFFSFSSTFLVSEGILVFFFSESSFLPPFWPTALSFFSSLLTS